MKPKKQTPLRSDVPLQSFYYVYGSWERYPFKGGWSVVRAENRAKADSLFRRRHPDRTPGTLNCAFVYTWDEFMQTGMSIKGNFGVGCREIIEENYVKEIRV